MKILAVDDDPIILELLAQFVDSIGEHELTLALSGQEALEIMQTPGNPEFDCFLFDIQMPHMDGIELTQKVRTTTNYTDTPILMLTAMSTRRYIDGAFAAGATDYVTKPFEVNELRERLSAVEGIVKLHKSYHKKINTAQAHDPSVTPLQPTDVIELFEPISIYDVENVIDYTAMENYVAQLSRSSLFGSSTFAFSIRKIQEHHSSMSAFEFYSMISDVAEIISDTLVNCQYLMCYAGNGTFVCVTESGWRPNTESLMDAINLRLATTELYDNKGQRLYVRVSAGEALRMIWKTGNSLMETIGAAHASAEHASELHEKAMNDFWLEEQRA